MDDRKVCSLIDEVHGKPIIWDKTVAGNSNKNLLGQEWNKIAANINVAKSVAQNKWKALVKKFKQENHLVQLHRSGDGLEDKYESKWPYYTALTFLANKTGANSSTGSLDVLFVETPTKKNIKEEVKIVTSTLQIQPCTSSDRSEVSAMTRSRKDIAAEILMMENKKFALLEQSSIDSGLKHARIEDEDKLNMDFFRTLLPILRDVSKKDILQCRNDLSRVVFSYAFKGSSWTSLSDSTNTANQQESKTTKRRRRANDGDDDCQIVSWNIKTPVVPFSNVPIKQEKKYEPTAAEREIERRYCHSYEVAKRQSSYQSPNDYRPPPQWNNQEYSGQHNIPPMENWQRQGAIPRQILGNMTNSPAPRPESVATMHNMHPSIITQPTAAQGAIAACQDKENQLTTRQTPTNSGRLTDNSQGTFRGQNDDFRDPENLLSLEAIDFAINIPRCKD